MLISKKEVCGKIRYRIGKIQFNKELKANAIETTHEKFNISTGDVTDYYAGRRELEDANTFVLFALAYGLDDACSTHIVKDSFTEIEIRQYSTSKQEDKIIQFPIVINCVQVSADQWIGSCDSKFLMELRDAQLINYNKNTQRTMQRIVRGDQEIFRISINKGAVSSIEESLNSNTFIPNTITLNIPEEEFDFGYNQKEKVLVINSLPYFDITDGYHRFLAISRLYDKDETFNYPLELRITHFSESRTRQFIFQEDQKTKMRKIDSDSMNTQAEENILLERMNTNTSFYWNGEILRNDGRINFGEMAKVIQWFYFKGRKGGDRKYVFELERDLVNKLNHIIADNPKLMEDRITFAHLMLIFYCMEKFENINDASHHVAIGLQYIDELKRKPGFVNRVPRKGILKYIDEII